MRTATRSSSSEKLTLAAMICVVAMTQIDMTIVSIAAPDIQHELSLSSTGVQWMVTGYLVALAAFFALGGRLADVVGRRTMVVSGTLVFIVASILCGATPTGDIAETWLVGFRILQGVGAAFMFPAALSIVVRSFPMERRGRAIAIFFAVAGALTAIGPFAGAHLVQWNWRAIFWVNVPVAAVGLILMSIAKVPNDRVKESIDWVGAALIAAGMGLSVVGFQQASSWGWESLPTLGCIIGGLILIGLFVEFERHQTTPLIRLSFFSNRVFAAQNAILLLASCAFVPVFFFASMYAQIALGWSTANAGMYLLIFFAGFAPGVQFGGRMLDKGRARPAVIWGSLLSAAGFFAWASRLTTLSENQQWPWIVLAGLGLGMLIGSANTDAINQVPSDNFGEATGVTQTARNYGASVGLAILGTILSTSLHSRILNSLSGMGIDASTADQVASAMHGSGGGNASSAFSQFGANAGNVFHAIQLDYAEACQIVFRGLGLFMAAAAVVAIFALPRHSGKFDSTEAPADSSV